MTTKSISKRTKIEYSDEVSYVEDIPLPIVAVALDYPDNHRIPAHIQQSAQLLYASAGVMTVTNVALDLGYDSPSAFICMFKRALGRTPGQYCKRNLNNDT